MFCFVLFNSQFLAVVGVGVGVGVVAVTLVLVSALVVDSLESCYCLMLIFQGWINISGRQQEQSGVCVESRLIQTAR